MNKKLMMMTVMGTGLLVSSISPAIARWHEHESDSGEKWGTRSSSRRDDSSRWDEGKSSWRWSNNPDAIVRRAYQDILNRDPDQEGLRTYRSKIIDENWTEKDVRNDLRKSAERAGRTPELADGVVRRAYQDILGRDPDDAGLRLYRNKIVYEGWSERDVRSDLKGSSERRETGGISADQAQQMVRRAYQSVLGRDPDSAGSALYVEKIRKNRWIEADVARALRNSTEYRQKHGKK